MSDTAIVEADPVSTELQTIRDLRRSDPDAYNNDKPLQGRELELLEAKLARRNPETGQYEARPSSSTALTVAPNADRLTEIQNLRKTDPDRYNADKKMLAEEVALIDAQLGNGDTTASSQAVALERLFVDNGVGAWERGDGAAGGVKRIDDAERLLRANVHADDWGAFRGTFLQLPKAALVQTFAELSRGAPNEIGEVTRGDLDNFATLPGGREALAGWGPNAPLMYAVVRERSDHILKNLSPEDSAEIAAWYHGLSPADGFAVLKMLAATDLRSLPKPTPARSAAPAPVAQRAPVQARPTPRQETAPRAVAETRVAPVAAIQRYKIIRDRDGNMSEIEIIR